MGADTFYTRAHADKHGDASSAFRQAVEEARWEHGHGGYTGTIAEKHDYVVIEPAMAFDAALAKARDMISEDDARISDKWGPAGCIPLITSKGQADGYLFFGWASS